MQQVHDRLPTAAFVRRFASALFRARTAPRTARGSGFKTKLKLGHKHDVTDAILLVFIVTAQLLGRTFVCTEDTD